MKIWKTIVAAALSSSAAFGTLQDVDSLEHGGAIYSFGLHGSTPLVDYFDKNKGKRPPEFDPQGSSLWRGHIAHWRIYNEQLWLMGIEVGEESFDASGFPARFNGSYFLVPYPIARLFPESGPAVLADWYTGEIVAKGSNPKSNDPSRPPNTKPPEVVFRFEKGVLVRIIDRKASAGDRVEEPEKSVEQAVAPDAPPASGSAGTGGSRGD